MKNTEKYNVKTRARKSNEDRTLFEQVNITDNFTLISKIWNNSWLKAVFRRALLITPCCAS